MTKQNRILFAGVITAIVLCLIYTIVYNLDNPQMTANKVKQAYNEINTALYKAQEKYGDFNNWSNKNDSQESQLITFVNNLDIKKKLDCGINDKDGKCWWSTELVNYYNRGVNKIKPDGPVYTFIDSHNNAVIVFKYNDYWGYQMIYDVNGKDKGPNSRGKDIFYFETGPENIEFLPGGNVQYSSIEKLRQGCFRDGVCCAWVIRTGNTEYLKANKDGVCKNGKKLSWFNTSCER